MRRYIQLRNYIDAAAFKEMILCANAALHANVQAINDLNVFPVPDGDTGTNMALTMDKAATELKKKEFDTIAAAADCVASALLRGARGNSGVILSLLFRGISRRLKGHRDRGRGGIRRRAVRRCRRGIQGRYEARGGHHTHRLPPVRRCSRRGRERGRKP